MLLEQKTAFMSATTDLGPCTDQERALLDNVAADLAKGVKLRRWFIDTWGAHSFGEQFDMTSTERDGEKSIGFFGVAELPAGVSMPVMGNAQQMFFDRPRTGAEGAV